MPFAAETRGKAWPKASGRERYRAGYKANPAIIGNQIDRYMLCVAVRYADFFGIVFIETRTLIAFGLIALLILGAAAAAFFIRHRSFREVYRRRLAQDQKRAEKTMDE